MFQHTPRRRPPLRLLLQTALNKVLEIIRPFDPVLRLVLQLRNRLPDNIREQVNQPGFGVGGLVVVGAGGVGVVGGEGEAVLDDLEEGDAERPDVGGDGVALALDAFGGHVVGGADEGVGVAFGAEFAGDAEVAEFDLPGAVEEDV